MQEVKLCDILLSPYPRMQYASYAKKCGVKLNKKMDVDRKTYQNYITHENAKKVYEFCMALKRKPSNNDIIAICKKVLDFFENSTQTP